MDNIKTANRLDTLFRRINRHITNTLDFIDDEVIVNSTRGKVYDELAIIRKRVDRLKYEMMFDILDEVKDDE